MSQSFFIAGTDTDAGKTAVTCGLLRYFDQQGLKTAAIKPVAAGLANNVSERVSPDSVQLHAAVNTPLSYQQINPILFDIPASPNFSAAAEQQSISVKQITTAVEPLLKNTADITLVEGCGGWLCPLNDAETMEDLVMALQLPVILVVGVRLGCLNHTLLTVKAIEQSGLPFSGWIANCIDPQMLMLQENIDYLTRAIDAPLLAQVGFGECDVVKVAGLGIERAELAV